MLGALANRGNWRLSKLDFFAHSLKAVEILMLKFNRRKRKCFECFRKGQTLGKLLSIGLKLGIHDNGIGEVARISQHVVSNPQTVKKTLPVAENCGVTQGSLLKNPVYQVCNPTFIFGMCIHLGAYSLY